MARVPRRLDQDPRSASLSPQEEHLLSLVDGIFTDEDLAFVTGLQVAQVQESLSSFERKGLISISVKKAGETETDDDDVELDPELRRQIDALYGRLDDMTPYELLRVDQAATKKEIRKAYYKLAPQFHPDKHFRKKLGSYKRKIEAIFTRLTAAHDTLRSQAKRQANSPSTQEEPAKSKSEDARGAATAIRSVPPTEITQTTRPAPPPRPRRRPRVQSSPHVRFTPQSRPAPAAPAGSPSSLTAEPHSAVRVVSRAPPSNPPHRNAGVDSSGRQPSIRPRPTPVVTRAPGRRVATYSGPAPPAEPAQGVNGASREAAARDALARKLGHRSHTTSQGGTQESRQRYDEIGRQARQRRCEMFMAKAEAALSKGCYREAAACFRRAQELAPDDADIAHKAAEAARLAGDK